MASRDADFQRALVWVADAGQLRGWYPECRYRTTQAPGHSQRYTAARGRKKAWLHPGVSLSPVREHCVESFTWGPQPNSELDPRLRCNLKLSRNMLSYTLPVNTTASHCTQFNKDSFMEYHRAREVGEARRVGLSTGTQRLAPPCTGEPANYSLPWQNKINLACVSRGWFWELTCPLYVKHRASSHN